MAGKFLPYKVLAALLYPQHGKGNIHATSWNSRQFYLRDLAKYCNTTNKGMKDQLEYLRQAGFILKVKHHKEPGNTGKLWSQVHLVMPTDGSTPPDERK